MSNNDLIQATKQALQALNVQRQALESEAYATSSELAETPESGGEPMGIDTPLVDRDGYPRGDIDVYRARSLRGRLAEVRTDHKKLMKEIERHLQQLAMLQNPDKQEEAKNEYAARLQVKPEPKFDPTTGKWVVRNWDGTVAGVPGGDQRNFADLSASPPTPTAPTTSARPSTETRTAATTSSSTPSFVSPFARIDAVAAHSPAEEAGLMENDLVVEFGGLDLNHPNPFRELADLVPTAAGNQESIAVKVLRGQNHQTPVEVSLTPRPWNGRGLIGCHIVPHPPHEYSL
jgi:Nas2 N_terminal domain